MTIRFSNQLVAELIQPFSLDAEGASPVDLRQSPANAA